LQNAKSGDTLIGNKSDGTILFTGGRVTSLSFTTENPEFGMASPSVSSRNLPLHRLGAALWEP
jgi:hypothetical protein